MISEMYTTVIGMLICCNFAYSVDVTMLSISPDVGLTFNNIQVVGPLMDVALETMKTRLHGVVNVTYIRKVYSGDSTCVIGVAALLADAKCRHQIDVLIGPYVTLLSISPDVGRVFTNLQIVGPLLDMALDTIKPRLLNDVNVTYIRKVFNGVNSCTNEVAAAIAEAWCERQIDVIIGPACSYAVEIVGRMASSWNIPIITPMGTMRILENKKDFTTLTRLAYNVNTWADFYSLICAQYGWDDIAIIYRSQHSFFTGVGEGILTRFEADKKRVLSQTFYADFDVMKLLQRARARSRVFLLTCDANQLRTIMLMAHDMGMTNGEYVFIFARMYEGDFVGDISWRRGDHLDAAAKRAYESLLVTQPRVKDDDETVTFREEVKLRAFRDYGGNLTDTDLNFMVVAFHDAVLVYAAALEAALADGGDFRNGIYMSGHLWNRTFKGSLKVNKYFSSPPQVTDNFPTWIKGGDHDQVWVCDQCKSRSDSITGDVVINENGDRDMDFSLLDIAPATGDYKVVANYFGANKSVQYVGSIHWPNNAGPPPNLPVCGFLGDDPACAEEGVSVETMIAGVLAGVVGLALLVVILIYTKYQQQSQLFLHWWKVKWEDIRAFSSRFSRSHASSLKSSCGDLPLTQLKSKHLATYKGTTVILKRLGVNEVKIDRQVLKELWQLRDLLSPNLTRLYGLCVEVGHVCLVEEHCSRGNLQDMVHNDDIKLDRDFCMSLMNDIICGMGYLHGSALKIHGRLNSSNCLIDGRFVLKLTNFGIPSIREQMKKSKINNNTELLFMAPECLKTMTSSQPGDVYSFSMVILELFTRAEPFEAELGTMNTSDLLEQIKCETSPIRPRGLDSSLDPSIVTLVKDCWQHNPEDRPDFTSIRRRTKHLFKDAARGGILDVLLQRMEQYANNLEGLVEERTQAFLEEKRKSDQLLLQILPRSVAEKLKQGQTVEPDAYESVSIYFSDIVSFTSLSAESSPMQIIDLLNDLYTCFDKIIDNFDVYKVETIGDAYMVVSGLPIRNGNKHVREICRMAFSIRDALSTFQIRHKPDTPLQARIGLHTGPVCAGVVGKKMPRYCLFGDTVNTASRIESTGEAMKIHISESTRLLLGAVGDFVTEERGEIPVKGKGFMKTYWLIKETHGTKGADSHLAGTQASNG